VAAVEDRMTSSTFFTDRRRPWPLITSSNIVAAVLPLSTKGCRTVVSPIKSAIGASSKPITETSSGTRIPRSVRTRIAAAAWTSDVATIAVAPQARTTVMMNMITAERDAITQRDLGASGLPTRIEAIDIVRPDPVALDPDIIAVAFDADLAIMMNVAVMHASPGPDADPGTAVDPATAVHPGAAKAAGRSVGPCAPAVSIGSEPSPAVATPAVFIGRKAPGVRPTAAEGGLVLVASTGAAL